MISRKLVAIAKLSVVLFLGVVLVSEALVYLPPVAITGPSVNVQMSLDGNTLFGNDSLSTNYVGVFNQVFYLANGSSSVHFIYYYYDSNYPLAYSDSVDWFGLEEHMEIVASERGLNWIFVTVNADQLAIMLQNLPPQPGAF